MTLVFVDNDGPARPVSQVPEGEATREHPLRDLIHDHPSMLPIEELEPGSGRIITVAKELRLPGAGSLDVLLVTEHGRLIIVECKLWRNPQARREVVGQILDYARELARYSYEDLQRVISTRLNRAGNLLYELIHDAGGSISEAALVDRITRDLRAGRFLLLIVGDGITEGTERIGEYLSGQAGLAFNLGLIEMAEYCLVDADGECRQRIFQPRLLARTTVIERHVIRSEVPGIVIDEIADPTAPGQSSSGTNAETIQSWRSFVERIAAAAQFDDPAQMPPRMGGINWMRLQLPGPGPLVLWRSVQTQEIGAMLRYRGAEGRALFEQLWTEREEIGEEFAAEGLAAPDWVMEEDSQVVRLTAPSPLPWTAEEEDAQQAWLARAANCFVNSFRPRITRQSGDYT